MTWSESILVAVIVASTILQMVLTYRCIVRLEQIITNQTAFVDWSSSVTALLSRLTNVIRGEADGE